MREEFVIMVASLAVLLSLSLHPTFFPFLFPVLFISILAFCAAGCLILSDNRRQLLHSVQLYQPSFLYAYLAIFMQGGVIQVRILKNFSSYTTSFPQSRKLEVLSMQRCCPLYFKSDVICQQSCLI